MTTRDGVQRCRCCGFSIVDSHGWCDTCVVRGHDQAPEPHPPAARQQPASPRDRQIRHPGRDR